MDHEQAALRLARRRRLGRRLGLAAVPVVLVVGFVATGRADGPPDGGSVLALVALAVAVVIGWWWLERSAGGSWPRPRARVLSGDPTPEELDDARAELALRTCSPPPPGGRARVEGLAARWSRDARTGLWIGPGYIALVVLLVLHGGYDGRGVPWPVAALWVVLALAMLGRSVHHRRLTRRWLAVHGTEPEVAGRP